MGKILRNKDLYLLRCFDGGQASHSVECVFPGVWVMAILSPRQGSLASDLAPTACAPSTGSGRAVCCILAPRYGSVRALDVSFRQLRFSLRDRTPFEPTSRIVPVCAFCILGKGHSSHELNFFRRSLWKSQKQGAEPGSSLRSGVTIYSTDHLKYLGCDDTG